MNAADNMKHTILRGECYTLLATCFYPPDREAFIRDGLIERLGHAMDLVCQPAAGILIKMGEALQQYSSEELSIEYAKLFMGPFRLKAPPLRICVYRRRKEGDGGFHHGRHQHVS